VFFDRVQHDAVMARVARRVDDKQVLRLLRRYLQAGVMSDEGFKASEEGTPQGFLDPYRRFRDATRTAGCGPACPVVWEAPG